MGFFFYVLKEIGVLCEMWAKTASWMADIFHFSENLALCGEDFGLRSNSIHSPPSTLSIGPFN